MSTPAVLSASRLGAPLLLAATLSFVLAGCEAEAVELAREISAARGDCTAEALRRSDEECVQMMERYTEMGTDLVHTYIGGFKALDMALDRMPPVEFDTAGLGYAISPELRAGNPLGKGASPRLTPAAAAYSYAPIRQGTAYDRIPQRQGVARPGPRTNGAGDGNARPVGPPPDRAGRVLERSRDARDRGDRFYDRRRYERFGYGPSDWWGYGDAYRYLESGPEGYFNSGPYAYFYRRPYGDVGAYGYGGVYGSGSYGYPYGYDQGYGYGSGYGYGYDGYGYDGYGYYDGYRDAYDPRAGYGYGYYDAYGDRYDPRGGYGYGYDDYAPYGYGDPYAPGRQYRDPYRDPVRYDSRGYDPVGPYGTDPYDPRYGAVQPDRALGGERIPADEWGYEPVASAAEEGDQGPPREGVSPAGSAAAPGRPAPQRPGILLPPGERLWRPWLDD